MIYIPEYFEDWEVSGLDPRLVVKLDLAREFAGIPFIITSGFRTPERNRRAGGGSNSAHLRGLAADISCKFSFERFRIVDGLYRAGFRRIVVYANQNSVHADIDMSLPNPVLVVK